MKKFAIFILAILTSCLFADGQLNSIKVVFGELGYSDGEIVEKINCDDIITLTLKNNNTNTVLAPHFLASENALRVYGQNTIAITALDGYTIEQIVIYSSSKSPIKRDTEISSDDSNYPIYVDGTVGIWYGQASNVVFRQPGLNGNSLLTSIEIKYYKTDLDNRITPDLSFPEESYTGYLGEVFKSPKPLCDIDDVLAEVKFHSSDEAVATIDSSGNVTLKGIGQCTISAYLLPDNQNFHFTNTQYNLNVVDLSEYSLELTPSLFFDLTDKPSGYNVRTERNLTGCEFTVCVQLAAVDLASNPDVLSFQLNSKSTGVGSGIYITEISENVVIKDIRIEFNEKNTGSVNVYRQTQGFQFPEKRVEYNWPVEPFITEFNGNSSIEINDFAFGIAPNGLTYIDKITVTFRAARADLSIPFNCEDFSKPYNLLIGDEVFLNTGDYAPEINYFTSNNEVARVADNTLRAVGPGNATITASWEAVDGVWQAGSASFDVSVAFNNLASIICKGQNGETYTGNFRVIVASQIGNHIYVTDGKDWMLFHDEASENVYTDGAIIAPGWYGNFITDNKHTEFTNLNQVKVEKNSVYQIYEYNNEAEVSFSDVKANSVIVMNDVTFDAPTPSTEASFSGIFDNQQYNFYNQYALAGVEPGKYNVKAAIASKAADNNSEIYPLEFFPSGSVTSKPTYSVKTYSTGEEIVFNGVEPGAHIYYRGDGYDPVPNEVFTDELNPANAPSKISTTDNDNITFNHSTHPLLFRPDLKVKYVAKTPGKAPSEVNYIAINSDGTITGISDITASNKTETYYFNLQGVRINDNVSLAPGVYIRLTNGTSTKIIIK